MNIQEILNQITEVTVEYGPKLIGAIIVWIIGGWVIKALIKGTDKLLDKQKIDESLKPFFKWSNWSAFKGYVSYKCP